MLELKTGSVRTISKIAGSLPHGEMERLYALNFLYSFIVAALAVIVPLYLLHLKVDITYIGIIVALGPLVFMVLRVIFASLADGIGTKMINGFAAVTNIAAIAIYVLMGNPIGFALGGFLEGVRASAFWAVVRTDILFVNGTTNASKVLAKFSGLRQFADSLGRLVVGFAIVYLSFQGSFLAIAILSIILIVIALTIGHNEGKKPRHTKSDGMLPRILKSRPKSFWQASILLMLVFVVINTLTSFMIPVYFTAGLGLSYEETGIFLALFSLATAIAMLLPLRFEINPDLLIFLALLMVPALVILPFSGKSVLIPMVILALGSGACNILNEYILVDQVFRSKDVSTDIGVLYIPLKLVEFSFLASAGFIAGHFGYIPLFLIQALFMGLAVAMIYATFRRPTE